MGYGYIAKETALNSCGRLKKGYRFVKGGRIVEAEPEPLMGLSGAKRKKSKAKSPKRKTTKRRTRKTR